MKPALGMTVVAIVLQSCTTQHVLHTTEGHHISIMQYDELMTKTRGKTVTIVFATGQQVAGTLTRADSDSIAWLDSDTNAPHVVPTAGISKLTVSHSYWLAGGVIGLLVGTVPLISAGAWNPVVHGAKEDQVDYSDRKLVIIVGASATLIGAGIGSMIRAADEYNVLVVPLKGEE